MSEKQEQPQEQALPYSKRFQLKNITSEIFGVDNPPLDWADVSLLVPHELLRREMQHLSKSVDKLAENAANGTIQPWQAVYFSDWYLDYFEPFVHEHHDIEEHHYFPWIMTRCEIPEKKFSKGHQELMEAMDEIAKLAKKMIEKKGVDVKAEVDDMKAKIHVFVKDMKSHIMEEERDIPPLSKVHFTEAEDKAFTDNLMKKEMDMKALRNIFPAMFGAMSEWQTPEAVAEFKKNIPGPLMHLNDKYWTPDYENFIKPKRDAPFLEKEPKLSQTGCFGIPFCFRCIC